MTLHKVPKKFNDCSSYTLCTTPGVLGNCTMHKEERMFVTMGNLVLGTFMLGLGAFGMAACVRFVKWLDS